MDPEILNEVAYYGRLIVQESVQPKNRLIMKLLNTFNRETLGFTRHAITFNVVDTEIY